MEKKCSKCGEPLDKPDETFCLFCKKEKTSSERQDIDDWVEREESDW